MALYQCVFFCLAVWTVTARSVVVGDHALAAGKEGATPISKVLDLIDKITTEVKDENRKERGAFNAFSTWCRKNTDRLNRMKGRYNKGIALKTASIGENTLKARGLHGEYDKRIHNVEHLLVERDEQRKHLADVKASWQIEQAKHDQNTKLVGQALTSLKDSRGRVGGGAALLQLPDAVAESVAMADAMGLITSPKRKAIATSLLQGKKHEGGPSRESYGYHEGSNDIVDLLESLKLEMIQIHDKRESMYRKDTTTSSQILGALDRKLGNNRRTAGTTGAYEQRTKRQVGFLQERVARQTYELEDTERVLKQITATCEARTSDYKERVEMRKQELEALNVATACLVSTKSAAAKQNRALLQAPIIAKAQSSPKRNGTAIANSNSSTKAIPDNKTSAKENATVKDLSFLQELLTKSLPGASLLKRADPSLEESKKRALGMLSEEGHRLHSSMLISMAARSKGDPFMKVKDLIKKLIDRLGAEALMETTKKGFCDSQVAEAEQERDTRFAEAKRLNTEVVALEAHSDALRESIKDTIVVVKETAAALEVVRDDYKEFKKGLVTSLTEQKAARDEIREALLVLRAFYAQSAAKAAEAGLLQEAKPPSRAEKMRANMLGSEKKGPSGTTPGEARQGGMKDVFGLLETVASDFDREVKGLETSLAQAWDEMTQTTRALSERQSAKEVQRKSESQELKDTATSISITTSDLQTSINLLDSSLQQLELLKPTCIDTGMSYKERVQKRRDEIDALKKALVILKE